MPTISLKPGRDKPVRNRHPWIFSGAIAHVDPQARDGDVVEVLGSDGRWLASGTLNRRSQIRVRLLSWEPTEAIDEAFWRQRLELALAGRRSLADDPQTNAYRLVHAESDGMPGLIVDRYADYLVVQCLTLGMALRKPLITQLLMDLCRPRGIVERSDADVRQKEGLDPTAGLLAGALPADPGVVEIREHGYRFLVDPLGGQKTGFYLDQRENRRLAALHCQGARVLNAFAYTGAFAVYTLAAGARHVVNLDTSREALELGERNLALNGFDPDGQAEGLLGNVFDVLRDWRAVGQQFEVIILDPPKFANSQRQVERAARAYKDINLLALQLLPPGGTLVTFSCSGLISADLFQKILFGAALDAGRDVQILARLSQGPDHPVLLTFPEGEYLKGLICRAW